MHLRLLYFSMLCTAMVFLTSGNEPSPEVAFRWAGEAYAEGARGVELYYLSVAAKGGHAPAQFLLATYQAQAADAPPEEHPLQAEVLATAQRYTAERRFEEALQHFEVAAHQGDATAQWALGEAYRGGIGGRSKDAALAVIWYRRAAAGGHSGAMQRLAHAYSYGEGVAKDAKLATYWQQRATEE